jgi:hypothetical protein
LLGQVTFTNETPTGWQTALFATPIQITANTTYVVSYWDPAGGYALDRPYFGNGVDNGILHALQDGLDGPNGIFASGSSAFPTKGKQASNYWVDVVFALTAP